jgi:hypothetical protein
MWQRIGQGLRLIAASARAVGALTAFLAVGGGVVVTGLAGPLLDFLGGWKYVVAVGLGLIFIGLAISLFAFLASVRILGTLARLNAFLLEARGTRPTTSIVLSDNPQTQFDLQRAEQDRIAPALQEHLELTLARYRASHRGSVKRAMRDLRILGVDAHALDRKNATVERSAQRVDEPGDFHDLERIRDLLADGVAQLNGPSADGT